MKNLKGGYKIIDLENNDWGSAFTVKGIFVALANSYKKPILVTGITISSTQMNDCYAPLTEDDGDYVLTLYGYTLTITDEDSVTATAIE